MNNGNLLNSLLGITGANPAATKTTAAKAHAESTEKFQQALEQVRPEIAARKPVARRDSTAADSSNTEPPASKPSVQRDSKPEIKRTDATSAASDNTHDVRATAADKSDSSACDPGSDKPVDGKQNEEQPTDSQSQTPAGELQQNEQQDQPATDAALIGISSLLLTEPSLPDAAEGSLASLESVHDSSHSLISTVVESTLTPAVTEAAKDTEVVNLTPLVAAQVALGQAATAVSNTADGHSLVAQAASNTLVGQPVGEAPAETDPEVDVLAADADTGENPDFLLLNSKAAMNKLAETTLAALDKAAPVVDLAKPTAASAAIETLTRLTEAQSPAARAFVVQTGVPATVGSPQWNQAVGDKVLWLAAQNVTSAEIRLDPPELGPMQVKVSINQDQASVTFTSPHPAVREALDQQLNRLREMFSEQGLNLVNVDVSDKSFTQREQEESAKHQSKADGDDEELAPVAVSQAISMRLVDHYA